MSELFSKLMQTATPEAVHVPAEEAEIVNPADEWGDFFEEEDTQIPAWNTPEAEEYEYPMPTREDAIATGVDVDLSTVQEKARLAEADFTVSYAPAGYMDLERFKIPRYEEGEYKGQPKQQYILNDYTGDIVGLHSGRYPSRDGYRTNFRILEDTFPNACEKVEVFRGGSRMLVTQRIGGIETLPNGDEMQRYLYSVASLDGSKRSFSVPKTQRIICQNALGLHLAIISAKATKNHDARLGFQADILSASNMQWDDIVKVAKDFTVHRMDTREFERMLKFILPEPTIEDSTRAKNKWDKTMSYILAEWRKEINNWGTEGNAWLAYNAVQGVEQHRINQNFKDVGDEGYAKGLEKSQFAFAEGKTPLADACESWLKEQVYASAVPVVNDFL